MPGKPEKKDRQQKKEQPEDDKLTRSLRRELMRWYCGALYSGKIKPGGKLGR